MKAKSVWFFEDVSLYNLLCPHKLKSYSKEHAFNYYKKKEFIYSENHDAKDIFIITEGKVKIGYFNANGDEIVTTILKRGELFGESAIFGESHRKEFAQSIDNKTSICSVTINQVQKLMKSNQAFSFKIYKFIGFKIKKTERHLKLLLHKDAKTRLLEFLKDLNVEYGMYCKKNSCNIISHPYTQKDIASLLAVSRPTLNILLNKLEKDKLIKINRNKITINKVLM